MAIHNDSAQLNHVFARMFSRAYELREAGDTDAASLLVADVKTISDIARIPISRRAIEEGVDSDSPLNIPQFVGTKEQLSKRLSCIDPFDCTPAAWALSVLWILSAKLTRQ